VPSRRFVWMTATCAQSFDQPSGMYTSMMSSGPRRPTAYHGQVSRRARVITVAARIMVLAGVAVACACSHAGAPQPAIEPRGRPGATSAKACPRTIRESLSSPYGPACSDPEPVGSDIRLRLASAVGPDYALALHEDGTVEWCGRIGVEACGASTWRISPAAMRRITEAISESRILEEASPIRRCGTDSREIGLTLGSRHFAFPWCGRLFGPDRFDQLVEQLESALGVRERLHQGA
jgi:hypothetical protein